MVGEGVRSIGVPRYSSTFGDKVSGALGCQGLLNIGVPKFQGIPIQGVKVSLCKVPLCSCIFVWLLHCWHLVGQGLKRSVVPRSPQHWGDKVCRALGCQGLHARWQGLCWQGCTWQLQTCVALELLALGRRRSQEHCGAKVFLNMW